MIAIRMLNRETKTINMKSAYLEWWWWRGGEGNCGWRMGGWEGGWVMGGGRMEARMDGWAYRIDIYDICMYVHSEKECRGGICSVVRPPEDTSHIFIVIRHGGGTLNT